MTSTQGKANRLIKETSPYLQQHAYNPVDWYPWGEEALEKAKKEDKPIIVSIGYSACHWCHVMERESFENEQLAGLMNSHFVCIKIDREERPDIDQIYMDAVHAMGVQGGWPLNVFLMPDQKPFYGGTYFPANGWRQLLTQVSQAFHSHRAELIESSEKFTEVLSANETEKYGIQLDNSDKLNKTDFAQIYESLAETFDTVKGGSNRAPKFPMPSIWQFLLRYYETTKKQEALDQVNLTLEQMAWGGIYDQIGGGFSRYSVDAQWFAPHFEKMLYDNGQLISLYSEAYLLTKKDLYKDVVYQTIEFVKRELTDESGGFFAALDADSEGVEGKYYTWSEEELKSVLGKDFELVKEYYNSSSTNNWEETNILFRSVPDEEFVKRHNLNLSDWRVTLSEAQTKMLQFREQRIRPGLDNKILSGWNGLMLKGLADAYAAFGNEEFLSLAITNATFIKEHLQKGSTLFRSYKTEGTPILGYLEDYTAVIQGYLALYQVTFDELWLEEAQALSDYIIANFYDDKDSFFFFTDKEGEDLIARKKELFDNVIPSSNSMMAKNLHYLGIIYGNDHYHEIAQQMFSQMSKLVKQGPRDLSNWASIGLMLSKPVAEVAIVGPEVQSFRAILAKENLQNTVLIGTKDKSNLPVLQNRESIEGKTTIYVCFNKVCRLPVFTISEALDILHQANK